MSQPYLDGDSTEDLARMLLSLLSEVWIMRDRMAVLERLLQQKLGLEPREIDDFVPDAAFSLEIQSLRDRVVGSVIGAPAAPNAMTVDAILRRAGYDGSADRLAARARDRRRASPDDGTPTPQGHADEEAAARSGQELHG